MSDSADEGDGWGGATPGGGGDMGPNSGSVVVFGVTFHGVVALATRQQYLLHNNNYIYIGKTWEEAEKNHKQQGLMESYGGNPMPHEGQRPV